MEYVDFWIFVGNCRASNRYFNWGFARNGCRHCFLLLLPLTYKMETSIAIAFLMGVFVGTVYGVPLPLFY